MSVFRGRHTPRLLQMLQEANLTWLQENQALALAMCTSCRATNSVDVIPRIVRRIELQPVEVPVPLRAVMGLRLFSER